MMAETAVKNATCESCGAEVRDESVYCYNCGKPVVTPPVEVEEIEDDNAEPVASTPVRPPLRSAASLRKKRRAFNRQPIEITWEPVEKSPTIFIAATIVL